MCVSHGNFCKVRFAVGKRHTALSAGAQRSAKRQSAVDADRLLEQFYLENPAFRSSIADSECITHFASSAMAFLTRFLNHLTAYAYEICDSESAFFWSLSFANMAAAGFFTLTGDRYQMTIPKELTIGTMTGSFIRLDATCDQAVDFDQPHPEWLLKTMTKLEAFEWVRRLDSLTPTQRVADREVLLEE